MMRISNVDILSGLLGEYQWLHLLKGRVYDSLIDYLINLAPQWMSDHNVVRPTIKKISEDLNEKRIHKWLPLILDDLIEINLENPLLFKIEDTDILYEFYASDRYSRRSLSYHIWTDKTFNKGDRFQWSFARTKLGLDYFWIKDIHHHYLNGRVNTMIYLEYGFQNRYRDFLLERALFENKLSSSQVYKLPDFTIDDRLKELYCD